jgi:membrane peptidoglycan carboxypeptidase
LVAIFVAAFVLIAGLVMIGVAWFTSPSPDEFDLRLGSRIRPAGARPVALSAVAPWLPEAVVAVEDERFYRHHGIDSIGLLRATAYDASHFSRAQGWSTITEQLAKALYFGGSDDAPWRKPQDAVVAFRIEGGHSKQKILDFYLNVVYFGHGAYGIERAGERYFGVAPGSPEPRAIQPPREAHPSSEC